MKQLPWVIGIVAGCACASPAGSDSHASAAPPAPAPAPDSRPPPGKLAILVDGLSKMELKRLGKAIREVEGLDVTVPKGSAARQKIDKCANHECRIAVARSLGVTHVLYGTFAPVGKMIHAQVSILFTEAPQSWVESNKLTFAADGAKLKICETVLNYARGWAKPLAGDKPEAGPFSICAPHAVRQAKLPSVEWRPSGNGVAMRRGEIAAWYKQAKVKPGDNSVFERSMKAFVAKKESAPAWVDRESWSEKTRTGSYLFAVGSHTGQPGTPPEWSFAQAEAKGLDAVSRVTAETAEGKKVDAQIVDWFVDKGGSVFVLVAAEIP
jgi:hypothetical protein